VGCTARRPTPHRRFFSIASDHFSRVASILGTVSESNGVL
jgi:hypothetical protein